MFAYFLFCSYSGILCLVPFWPRLGTGSFLVQFHLPMASQALFSVMLYLSMENPYIPCVCFRGRRHIDLLVPCTLELKFGTFMLCHSIKRLARGGCAFVSVLASPTSKPMETTGNGNGINFRIEW
jgi:hypothetical protein